MSALSVFSQKSSLGITVFSCDSSTFRLISGWNLISDLCSLYQVATDLDPECILCPPSLKDQISALLPATAVETVSNSEFRFEDGKALLMDMLRMNSDLQFDTRFSADMRLAICALAPLHQFVTKSNSGPFKCCEGARQFLMTDLETLRNLQIIKDDFHPSTIKSAGRSKEGFSVFNLLDKTVTRQGRRVLRQWVLQPLQSVAAIRRRLSQVSFFAMNPVLAVEIHRNCKDICDLEKVLARFRGYTEKPTDWGKLHKSLKSWEAVHRIVTSDPTVATIVAFSDSIDVKESQELCYLLETSVELGQKVTGRYPAVRPGVSRELDYLKQSYENLETVLTQLAQVESEELHLEGRHRNSIGVVYFPQLGYLVELKANGTGLSTGGYSLSQSGCQDDLVDRIRRLGYEFQFRTEEAVYYKSGRCRDLDDRFGDLVSMMRDIEGAEVRRLEEEVLRAGEGIGRVSRLVGEVDAIISLAAAAGLYNWSCPEVREEPGIEIVNGRHPLVELCVPHFIPNDTELTNSCRLGLITGPNSSGKSVYLKMVGIIVYLAHCGSFVPAESALISLCDRLFTRINVRDGGDQSAFTHELHRLSVAITDSTSKSLILLDELGKNTATEDGMSLVYGTLAWLAQRDTPFTLISTHYRELVTLGVVKETDKLRFFAMEMKESDEPVFLYKLIPGVPQSSLAFHCARLAGVPGSVVDRAEEIRRRMRMEK